MIHVVNCADAIAIEPILKILWISYLTVLS